MQPDFLRSSGVFGFNPNQLLLKAGDSLIVFRIYPTQALSVSSKFSLLSSGNVEEIIKQMSLFLTGKPFSEADGAGQDVFKSLRAE